MENLNIGIVNLIVSNKLNESYYDKNLLTESKKIVSDFLNIVKNSPILQLEFKIYNNIENKHIDNDLFAKDYLNNNIKLFEVYTIEEIQKEHDKLKPFVNENNMISDERINLYNAINDLIIESVKISEDVDVDKIHESFVTVFNHIKTPKKTLTENIDANESINEEVLEIAIDKFNEKYSSINEDDKVLIKKLIKSNAKEKKSLLETYKKEITDILEGLDDKNVQDSIEKAKIKINEMSYDRNTVDDKIIELHEFKKELL